MPIGVGEFCCEIIHWIIIHRQIPCQLFYWIDCIDILGMVLGMHINKIFGGLCSDYAVELHSYELCKVHAMYTYKGGY